MNLATRKEKPCILINLELIFLYRTSFDITNLDLHI